MRPENMTLAAVNVDHQELEQLARKYFTSEEPSWSKLVSDSSSSRVAEAPAVYKSGIVRVRRFGWGWGIVFLCMAGQSNGKCTLKYVCDDAGLSH